MVRAQRGQREAYLPVVSMLARGSEPVTLARALCAHCASPRLYVADLDALMGGAAQVEVLQRLLDALPGVTLWLDAGFADGDAADALGERLGASPSQLVPVFASEALRSRAALQREGAVLSLDRHDGARLDAAGCWDAPALWPRDLIVMTLERVGADRGPDLATLREVQAQAPTARVTGAGGIRDAADLARARDAGAHAWLVASALHDGRLPAQRG